MKTLDEHLRPSSLLADEHLHFLPSRRRTLSCPHDEEQSPYEGGNVTVNVTSRPLFVFGHVGSNGLRSVRVLVRSFASVIVSIMPKFGIPPISL